MTKPSATCADCDIYFSEKVTHAPEIMLTKFPVLRSPMWDLALCRECFEMREVPLDEQNKGIAEVKAAIDRWNRGVYTDDHAIIEERAKRRRDRKI
jgi:hypothetical protein